MSSDLIAYSACVAAKTTSVVDRAVAFLYYRHRTTTPPEASVREIAGYFITAGLGSPNSTRLKKDISADHRTCKVGSDKWRIKLDYLPEAEGSFADCFTQAQPVSTKNKSSTYVNLGRIAELASVKNASFDLSKLIRLCEEINIAFSSNAFLSTIILTRAIIDHVPPIFGQGSFSQVVGGYGTKSFKESMGRLDGSSRKIADQYLHGQIRNREVLPNETQVDFSPDIDLLLAEVYRVLK
jgi:hypothetical protein